MLELICFQHLFTPIAVDWAQFPQKVGYKPKAYRTLYIFGLRLITWRVDIHN